MSTGVTTSGGLSNRTNVYAEKKMLKNAAPVVVLDRFAMQKQMPKNKTTTVKFRRPKPFAAQTTPLVEGVTPAATVFQYEDVSGTLKQYGQTAIITDVIEDTNEDPVLNDLTLQLGENIGRTMEALDWGVLRAGTNVFYANGSLRTAVNTKMTRDLQRKVIRGLKKQKAQKVSQVLDASPNFNTRAVEAAYVAVCHTDLESDIRDMPGFVPCSEYGQKRMVHENEIGTVEEVRYVTSPDLEPFASAGGAPGSTVLSTNGSAADVYPILIMGKEAYGRVALRGQGAISPSIIPVGQKTKDDPLGQRGVAGWKGWHLCIRLNELWIARVEVAASAL